MNFTEFLQAALKAFEEKEKAGIADEYIKTADKLIKAEADEKCGEKENETKD